MLFADLLTPKSGQYGVLPERREQRLICGYTQAALWLMRKLLKERKTLFYVHEEPRA